MSITCAILKYDPGTVEPNATTSTTIRRTVFPVLFQVPTTDQYITCSTVKISVDSVRWPHTRITSIERPKIPLLNLLRGSSCLQTGSCVTIDAAIWVTPLCGGGDPSPVCLESFTRAGCFPYCLAVRQSGSFNSVLRLYNARQWTDRVHIFNRDCAFHQYSKNPDAGMEGIFVDTQDLIMPPSSNLFPTSSITYGGLASTIASTSRTVANTFTSIPHTDVVMPIDWVGSIITNTQANAVSDLNCVSYNFARSTVPISDNVGSYGSTSFRSTLAFGQPFVFAGDTILTSFCNPTNNTLIDADCVVHVHRIYGDDTNHMTLVNTNNRIPAVAPPETPSMMEKIMMGGGQRNAITIPYSLTNHPWASNPAVGTEDSIFYAVNPYWQLFTGFISYCNDPTEQGRMQLTIPSSFSPIIIWRVNPYVYCPPSKESGCYEDIFTGVKVPLSERPRLNIQDCKKVIDFIVTGMQYIDYENIAVSVLRTTPEMINPETLQPFPNRQDNVTHTVTYFLNTITMQIRENVSWATEIPQAVQTQGQLCPNQRRMPQFGSVMTETLVASILFIKLPFNIILNGAYIFNQWTSPGGDRCPLITRGHTALLSGCESNALSFKPFFESAERANQLLFRTISIVARILYGLPGGDMPRTFLNGVQTFAENTMSPLSAYIVGLAPLNGVKVPIQKSTMDIFNSVLRMPSYMRMFVVAGTPTAWTNFFYHFVVDLIYRIVRATTDGTKPEAVFYATMYDFQEQFDQIVESNMKKACTGLSLTFGYTNPWALIIRHQCDSWASVPSGVLKFLSVFLVDIPTAKCLCKDAQGNNFARYATDVCFAHAPNQAKPALRKMIDAGQDLDVDNACDLIIKYTQDQMSSSLQPFFDKQYEAAENMGSSLDYLLRIGTQQSSSDDLCTNFQTNPYVVAIVPEPVDYFRACGLTSVCRSRCRAEIEAFEDANINPSKISREYRVSFTQIQTITITKTTWKSSRYVPKTMCCCCPHHGAAYWCCLSLLVHA